MADEFGQRIQGLHAIGDTPASTDKHIAVLALDDGGDYAYLNLDSAGKLLATGGTEYQDGASNAGAYGALVLGDDGTNLQTIKVDSTGRLDIVSSDLDIRNLSSTQDSIAATVTGAVTVSATDLDIRNLESSTDSVTATISGTVTVASSDLDIRNLEASTDNVAISDGTYTMAVNSDGSINVVSSEQALDSIYSYGTTTLVKDTSSIVVSVAPGADQYYSGVMVSGAGYCEWQLQFGSTPTTIMSFWTTPAHPTEYVDLPDYLEVSSGETIRVVATNREKAASPTSDFAGYATLIRKA
jgi:hypothetical protein